MGARAERAIRKYGHLLGKPGYFTRVEGPGGEIQVVPWTEPARERVKANPMRVPDQVVERMRASLEPRKRRTPSKRLEAMTRALLADAEHSYRTRGVAVISRSICDEICRIAALEGYGFMNPDRVARMSYEQIRPLLEALAKRQFTEAGHKQADSDRKKVVRDWHGHGNHTVSLAAK